MARKGRRSPYDVSRYGERRRCERHKADYAVAIEFNGRRLPAKLADYSEHGFGAVVDHYLPVGWFVFVDLQAGDHNLLRLQTRAIYKENSKYGFEFVVPEPSKRPRILDFFRNIRDPSA